MKMFTLFTLGSLIALPCFGCGDDTGGSGGGGDDATTGSGNTTGNATGGSVNTCAQLCDLEPTATTSEKDCVGISVAGAHPSVVGAAECQNINSPETCMGCYGATSVTDASCAAAHRACF